MIIYTHLPKQNALHAAYAELKGIHFGLGVVISRLSAEGQIISCVSVFQYLTELRDSKRGLTAYIGSLR